MRTRLSLVKPNLAQTVEDKLEQQKKHHDKGPERLFQKHDKVCVRNVRGRSEKWLPGTVVEVLGPHTFLMSVGGKLRYVHVDHLVDAPDLYLEGSGIESVESPEVQVNDDITVPEIPGLITVPRVQPQSVTM